jgi:hypothetical protein
VGQCRRRSGWGCVFLLLGLSRTIYSDLVQVVLSTWRRRGKAVAGKPSRQDTSAYEVSTGRIAPSGEGVVTRSLVLTGREPMAAELEMVVDRAVSGEKLLSLTD